MTAPLRNAPVFRIGEALSFATAKLTRREVDSPALSAQLLLAHVLELSRMDVLLERQRPLSTGEWHAFWRLIARRGRGEPAAIIMGRKEFFGRDFCVSSDVLVPRPETEHMVEAVLRHFSGERSLLFADLGTGSGTLAVTLAAELPLARGLALDLSPSALAMARRNAGLHGVSERLLFFLADFCNLPLSAGCFDLVVANPPYVSERAFRILSREVRLYEPKQALVPLQDGGRTGLESLTAILPQAWKALRPGGLMLVEIGTRQGSRALRLASELGSWIRGEVLPDLAGHDRVLFLERDCG